MFGRVAEHLRPGGVFVFDAYTEQGMKLLSGMYLNAEVGERRFALRFAYDPARRVEESSALVAEGVEVHRRVPIEPVDVTAAVHGTGLRLDDYFTDALFPGRWDRGFVCNYVLSKRL